MTLVVTGLVIAAFAVAIYWQFFRKESVGKDLPGGGGGFGSGSGPTKQD